MILLYMIPFYTILWSRKSIFISTFIFNIKYFKCIRTFKCNTHNYYTTLNNLMIYTPITTCHFLPFLKNIFIDHAITVVPFPPFHSTPSCTPPPAHIPLYSPWVIHISSLASTFPMLFLPSPHAIFCLKLFAYVTVLIHTVTL